MCAARACRSSRDSMRWCATCSAAPRAGPTQSALWRSRRRSTTTSRSTSARRASLPKGGEEVRLEGWTARLGERPDVELFLHHLAGLLAHAVPHFEIRRLRAMRFHGLAFLLLHRRDVDRGAEAVAGPPLRLHLERLHVLGEPRLEIRQAVDELRAGDEAIATLHVDVIAKLRLVARDARELDRTQRAQAGGDVVGMAVATVGTPGDHDIGPHASQPTHDVSDHVALIDTHDAAVGVLEAGDRRETHTPSGLRELQRACRANVLARDDRRALTAGPTLLAFGETETVDRDALGRVADERPARAERLVIGVREDRRERPLHALTICGRHAGVVLCGPRMDHCVTTSPGREPCQWGSPAGMRATSPVSTRCSASAVATIPAPAVTRIACSESCTCSLVRVPSRNVISARRNWRLSAPTADRYSCSPTKSAPPRGTRSASRARLMITQLRVLFARGAAYMLGP